MGLRRAVVLPVYLARDLGDAPVIRFLPLALTLSLLAGCGETDQTMEQKNSTKAASEKPASKPAQSPKAADFQLIPNGGTFHIDVTTVKGRRYHVSTEPIRIHDKGITFKDSE